MTKAEAEALALFVKDHDTRFLAKAGEDEVILTQTDGTRREPVRSLEAYREHYVTAANPSVLAAWEKWQPGSKG